MIWIIMLIAMVLLCAVAMYKKTGEGYSAGRGFFKGSEYDLDDGKKDFSDYDPWNYDDMRK